MFYPAVLLHFQFFFKYYFMYTFIAKLLAIDFAHNVL